MPTLIDAKEKRQKRATLAAQSRAILDTAQREKRALTSTEQRSFDETMSSVEALEREIRDIEDSEERDRRRAADGNVISLDGSGVTGSATILEREQRFTDWTRAHSHGAPEYPGLTAGGYLRAMVMGPKTDVERRALSEGTDSAGGYAVPDILASTIIDRMRARATVFASGARTVPLQSDVQKIARLATDPTAAWVSENAALTASDPTFEVLTFTPQALVSHVRASRQLLQDSVNIDAALENAFVESLAREIDRVALRGSGTPPEPRGLRTMTGVNEISMGVNGLQLTNHDKLLDARQLILDANGPEPTSAIMATRTDTTIAKFKDTTNQPLDAPSALRHLVIRPTTQVLVNETQGTANNASTVYLGGFAELFIGIRSDLRIEVLKERYADNLQYGFIAWMRADVQAAHAASFARIIGIIP